MKHLRTNRDLYLAIDGLGEQFESCERALEIYLRAVFAASQCHKAHDSISLSQFFEILSSAFTIEPASFNEDWRREYDELPDDPAGYLGWYATIVRQMVDLREMEAAGTLDDEYRYFGVYSPRESRWYNFDPLGYLECAMAGSLGGWQPGDDTGRQYVPGPVAVLGEGGSIESVAPEDLPDPTFEIPAITWDRFAHFLYCGQSYE